MVLYSRRDPGGDGAVYNSFLFQRRLRSPSAGQLFRPEQARANGVGQCDSRSQREDLRPNLRREPRDSALREVGSGSDQRRDCSRGRKVLRAPRLRFARHHSCSAQKSDGRPCPPGRQHHHTTAGAQQFLAQRKNISPEAAGDFSGQAHRRQFQQTEDPRAVFEPDLFRWRHVRSGSSRARVLWQICARYDAGGVRHTRRPDQKSKPIIPWSDRANSRETRDFALDRMRDNGFITHEQCVAARAEKIAVGSRQNAQGQTYAVDYIRQQVIAAVGWDRAINEGYRIHTTIDVDLQRTAEDSLKAHLEQAEKHPDYNHQTYADYAASFRKAKSSGKMAEQPAPEYLQGAAIGLDNASGDILVLVGGRDFEHNQFNRALQARRPAGTAMLPFVYATAFERGMYPGSVVEDSPLDNRAVMIGGTTGILGEWGPENADNQYEGRMTARQALVKSKNGATVRIGMDAGIEAVLQLCSSAGIRSQLRPYPATFLGSSEVTLAELAMGYTIFPNGGWRPSTPHILERIEEKDGTVVWDGKQQSIRKIVTKPETAYEVHSCLVDALQSGTGKAAYTQFGLKKFPAAGKTGTAYDFTDALFAGYDSSFTCAVWAGFDKPQKIYRGAFGRELALPIWVDIMNAAAQSYPPREIKQPSSLKQIEICSRSGQLATDKCYDAVKSANGDTVQRRSTYMEIATQAQAPTEVCNIHGEPRARLAREFGSSELPRAELAVNLSEVMPVAIKSPTLIAGDDPYDSIKATVIPDATPQPATETAEAQKTDTATGANEVKAASNNASLTTQSAPEIRKAVPVQTIPKAIPVQPQERQPTEIRRAVPVKPLDQEDTERTLLRSAAQPPGDLHE